MSKGLTIAAIRNELGRRGLITRRGEVLPSLTQARTAFDNYKWILRVPREHVDGSLLDTADLIFEIAVADTLSGVVRGLCELDGTGLDSPLAVSPADCLKLLLKMVRSERRRLTASKRRAARKRP